MIVFKDVAPLPGTLPKNGLSSILPLATGRPLLMIQEYEAGMASSHPVLLVRSIRRL